MECTVRPIIEDDSEQFNACIDSVARERKYLGFVQAPSIEKTVEYIKALVLNSMPAFVAVINHEIVGWCDVDISNREAFSHVGTLGMGIKLAHRGKGIGLALIDTAIDASKRRKLEKIELGVIQSNANAIRLYKKVGFENEGILKRKFKIDGKYEDMFLMGKFI
jgi:ribosomal protein S18 acetylase RimI-like enzyme